MTRKVPGLDGREQYVPAEPVRFPVRGGAVVVQPYRCEWGDGKSYSNPFLPMDPPPAALLFESSPLASLAELSELLERRGVRLIEEVSGREEALAELFLAYTNLGLPFWRWRFNLYPPGEFEAHFGLPREGGRPRVDGGELVFWTAQNLFEKRHLEGFHEIRWNLTSLVWNTRQLASWTR
jgi:hypothetical protein